MFELADDIAAELNDAFVSPAFLDGTPDIRTIADELVHQRILVVPFMASEGYYTNVVFPQALSRKDKTLVITEAIGADPRIAQLVGKRISELADQRSFDFSDTTIVVVGHGTRKNKNSCRTTIELVKRLRISSPGMKIEFAFIDQNPSLDHVVQKLATRNVLVVPFLMGMGPHTTEDVPNAFGIAGFSNWLRTNACFPFIQARCDGLACPNPTVNSVSYDMPVGVYPELKQLCIERLRNQVDSHTSNVAEVSCGSK